MALLYEQESYAILGACFEVYKQKGTGFVEPVYQECLQIEFELQNIPHVRHPELEIDYKGRKLELRYKPDFVCYGQIIVEVKAVTDLNDIFRAQVQNYLRATSFKLGLLVNFAHHPKLEYERIIR